MEVGVGTGVRSRKGQSFADGQTDGRMDGFLVCPADIAEQKDSDSDPSPDGRIDGWMDGWVDGLLLCDQMSY
ncbi:hypothetical protein AXG93_3242s1250 [Marchantia polymorpha subsp. ruderalis]|uniref:Uncharacterized protein n=1 Tax=Marchantia polymorpha subsp. ruderalis TaxID=1480154 RepID=A0A176WIN2_MARPO|nr:hypothetical protein AXG93_3242s1250 [Marchantia polymorpha subsp. ruderalis]